MATESQVFRDLVKDTRKHWWQARGVNPTKNLLALPVTEPDKATTEWFMRKQAELFHDSLQGTVYDA